MAASDSAAAGEVRASGPRIAAWLGRYGTGLALVLLILFNFAFTPNFATWQTLNINLTQVSTIVIVGDRHDAGDRIGRHRSLGRLADGDRRRRWRRCSSSTGSSNFPTSMSASPRPSRCPCSLAGAFGFFNGWLITRYKIQPIVATLDPLHRRPRHRPVVHQCRTQVIFTTPEFQFIGLGRVFGIPVQVIIMAVIVALAAWVLRRTVFGKQILAIGGNEAAARLAGIRVDRIKRAGLHDQRPLLAALPASSSSPCNSAADANLVGLGVELDAIAAVAVGGTLLTGGRATVLGTLMGALIIQLVRFTLLANGVPDAAALVVKAGLIVLAVWLQRKVTLMNAALRFLRTQGGAGRPRPPHPLRRLALRSFPRPFNILTFLRYNSMFALIALGMCFVIMTGGIDLSVGSTAAMSSVIAAYVSPARPAARPRRGGGAPASPSASSTAS